jgi:hypothetical protein
VSLLGDGTTMQGLRRLDRPPLDVDDQRGAADPLPRASGSVSNSAWRGRLAFRLPWLSRLEDAGSEGQAAVILDETDRKKSQNERVLDKTSRLLLRTLPRGERRREGTMSAWSEVAGVSAVGWYSMPRRRRSSFEGPDAGAGEAESDERS